MVAVIVYLVMFTAELKVSGFNMNCLCAAICFSDMKTYIIFTVIMVL
jgi:hypothetical protein